MNPTQVLRTGVLVLTIHPFLGFLAAQGIGAMQYIPLREKPHKAKLEMTTGWPSLCTEDHVYTFETAREGLSPIYKYFGYAFDRKAGTVAAVRNMGLPEVKNIAPVESFFIAGDRPAYVQRTWDKDAGEVGLSAQLLDPSTLLPDGDPVRIAKIPLDPKGYVHTLSLGVEVLPSPDGTKLLFCYDRVQSGGMQVVMLWVTDTKLQPVWSGMYKVPTQALGYQRDVLFDDAGRVYLKVNAILLDGDDVKVRSDGTQKVKVKANYANKRTHTWFRMHEKDYRMWDGVLPDGRVPESLGMALSNGGLSLGGFVEEDGAWEWVTLRL
ncbi:MAG TPA: hypothetical protein VGE21_15450, partial [Flavobacteriales bacterium]